jgi:hypothetical protein
MTAPATDPRSGKTIRRDTTENALLGAIELGGGKTNHDIALATNNESAIIKPQ